jgi:short-subunit dehydrogenase
VTASAVALPLTGLVTAGREVGGMVRRRLSPAGRRAAERALAAAADGGWALVTGASSGIGRSYALALAGRGLRLALTAEDHPGLDATATEARSRGARDCVVLPADLAEGPGIAALVDGLGGRRVEVLVNNAGIGMNGPFTSADPEAYARLLGVNLLAPVLLTRALLPAMVERRRGAVVHVASINAVAPVPTSAVYSAGKAFLLAYATAVWAEHRADGVAFQTVLPGTTATSFHERQGTRVPPWALGPDDVVRTSLDALGTTPVVVPGGLNRVLRGLGGLLPLELRTAAAGRVIAASLRERPPEP